MHKQNDIELIAQSMNGDQVAYAELVDRYKNALYRHCFAIVRDEDVAEDIAQDVFVTAYYKLATYNAAYKFSTWLFKIGTNKALNYLKKHAKERPMHENLQEKIVSKLPSPERKALHAELESAVGRLRPKYRVAIRLHYWEGMKYEEVAATLAVSEGTVKSWLNRAKTQLRKELS